jgi:hypothetical protein
MSRTFGTVKSIKDSSTYIIDKKAKSIFCIGSNCLPLVTSTANQSCYDLLNTAKLLKKPVKPNYNNLAINLITALDLTGVDVIVNNATGASPTVIDVPTGATHAEFIASPADPTQFIETHLTAVYTDDYRYTMYTIDPSGNLFGNTECGLENWKNYLVLEPP